MDVLFDSIDVKSLLPTADSDSSSPLSAPDLRLLIDRLNHRSLQIQNNVHHYILSHHHHFSQLFSLCSNSLSLSHSLASDLSSALDLLSTPADLEIRDLAVEIADKTREIREKREALAVVEAISWFLERLERSKGDLRGGRLLRAAEAVRDLEGAVAVDENGPSVFRMLREERGKCFDELQETLAKLVEAAVQFDSENGVLRVTSRLSMDEVDGFELREVIEALDIVGALDYGFAKVADLLVKHVMKPVISNDFVNISTEHLPKNSDKSWEAVLKLIQTSGSEDRISIYSKLIEIIRFINKSICYENGIWMFCLGRLTWSRISELVITFCLSKAIPDDASKMAEFENIIKCTIEFEAFLKEIQFISQSDSKDEKLSLFVHNVEVHFATRRRNGILATARDLILQCNFVPPPVSGNDDYVDLLFQPERCIISKAAQQLMEVVHQTLKDVCLSPTRVAVEFYHAARDALLLYRAIVPVKGSSWRLSAKKL